MRSGGGLERSSPICLSLLDRIIFSTSRPGFSLRLQSARQTASSRSEIWTSSADRLRATEVLRTLYARVPLTGSTRSEEHTSELQSLMRISYAVFSFHKKTNTIQQIVHSNTHSNAHDSPLH